jgi:hypothetical protein
MFSTLSLANVDLSSLVKVTDALKESTTPVMVTAGLNYSENVPKPVDQPVMHGFFSDITSVNNLLALPDTTFVVVCEEATKVTALKEHLGNLDAFEVRLTTLMHTEYKGTCPLKHYTLGLKHP